MVNYKEIIKTLTKDQITAVLTKLGSSPPKKDREGNLIFQSVCHNSDSWKLYYFIETHTFYCYSRCQESFNIFSLTMKTLGISFGEALRYVCETLGINIYSLSTEHEGFFNTYCKSDWDLFDKYNKNNKELVIKEEEKIYNENVLNLYRDIYYYGWLKENIGIEAMKKYNIKYDIVNNRIVIPHYNINNQLVGIRCRNLEEGYAKYCPIDIENVFYSHNLSKHLYGLSHNKETIQKLQKIMIVEAEKSVLMCETYFPNSNFTVACCGSNLCNAQIQLLIGLRINEVILAFDFDFETVGDIDYLIYKRNVLRKCKKLIPYFNVYTLNETIPRLLTKKSSPTDGGKDILLQYMKNKTLITEEVLEFELKEIEERIEKHNRK